MTKSTFQTTFQKVLSSLFRCIALVQLFFYRVLQQLYLFSETFFLIFYHGLSALSENIHIHDKGMSLCLFHQHMQYFLSEYLLSFPDILLLFQDFVLYNIMSFFSCDSKSSICLTDCLITTSEYKRDFFLCIIRVFCYICLQLFRVYFFKTPVKRFIR